jgi:hypothetical protein
MLLIGKRSKDYNICLSREYNICKQKTHQKVLIKRKKIVEYKLGMITKHAEMSIKPIISKILFVIPNNKIMSME